MTFKEKYYSIDQSKLPEKAKVYMEEFKKDTKNFTDKEAMKIIMPTLDGFIKKLKESGYESAIKTSKTEKPKKEKVVKKKTAKEMVKEIVEEAVEQPKTIKGQPKMRTIKQGDYMRVAKEIRKEGEPWKDALKRAKDFITTQKEVKKEEAKRQYQKLKEFIEKQPEYYPKDIPTPSGGRRGTTLERDAVRVALPKGKRISKKTGKTYYEYRSNRIDKRRDDYPYLAKGGELDINKYAGAGMFARGGMFEVGDKVMVNDSGYMKLYHGFDLSEPATIISKNKSKVSGKVMYFYGLELADGKRPYNTAPESKLKKVEYAKGGEVDAIFDDGGEIDYSEYHFRKGDELHLRGAGIKYFKEWDGEKIIVVDKRSDVYSNKGSFIYPDRIKKVVEYNEDDEYADGGEIPQRESLKYFIMNEASTGSIANKVPYSSYDDIKGVRWTAYQILLRDGDKKYSLQAYIDLIKQAVEEYEENKYEMSFADGGMTKRMIALPVGTREQIEESIRMGYDTLVEGMISPKTRGVMLIDKDSNVRGAYPMLYKGAIEEMLHNLKGYAKGGKVENTLTIEVTTIAPDKHKILVDGRLWSKPKKENRDIGEKLINVLYYTNKNADKNIQIFIDGVDETDNFKQSVISKYTGTYFDYFIDYLGKDKYAKGGEVYGNLRKRFESYTDEELQIFNGDNEETLKNWNRGDAIEEAINSVLEESDEYAKGGEMRKPTNQEVYDGGDIIDSWSSDIGGSNESEDNVIEYEGNTYLVSTNAEDNSVIKPKSKAQIYEYAKGGELDINKYAGAGMFAEGGYVDRTILPTGIDNFVYFNTEEDGKIIWNIISATNNSSKSQKARNFLAKNQGKKITLLDGTQVKIDSYGQSSRFILERDLKINNGIVRIWNEFIPKYWYAKGGELEDFYAKGGYTTKGEDYEYVNTFGISQKDFEEMVDAWHKTDSYDQMDRIESRLVFRRMTNKYGEEKVEEINKYIWDTHNAHEHSGKYAKGGGIGNKTIHFADLQGESLPSGIIRYYHKGDDDDVKRKIIDFAKKFNVKISGYEYPNDNGNIEFYSKGKESDLKSFYKEFFDIKENIDDYISNEERVYGIPFFEEDYDEYAKGGKIGFKGLSDKVAKYYTNKKVPSKYQNLYGKTYDKKEAKEVGDKVASKVYYLQKSKMAKGGEVSANEHFRSRGVEFLRDDLETLQQAIQDNNGEEIQKFFSYWGQHLNMLETDSNERMYNFLKDDMAQLEKAIEENNQEEIDKFFSYWNYHLSSLKMAKGGEISVYNLRKGDKVKTRKGDIETIIRKTGSGSYETIENDYTHSPESLEFISRPSRKKMAKGGGVGNTTHEKVTLIFDGKEHKYDMVFVDGVLEDVLLPYTSMDTPLFNYLEKEFDDWLEYAGRDYEAMYFSDEAIYSKRGAIRGAMDVIEETISDDKGKKKVYNLDKGEVDFMSAFS
jgi:hypothetical protein